MKRVYIIISFLFLIFYSSSLIAQVNTKPKPPTFNYLTINPTTGNPTLFWTAPAFDPLFPVPTGYIIYRIIDGIRVEIAKVDNATFSFTDLSSISDVSRLTYTLASDGLSEPSQLTTDHSNIFLRSEYDSCNKKINLIWDLYQGWNNSVIAPFYDVYIGDNPDWASFQLAASVDRFSGRYIINNVQENQHYYAYVTAKRTDAPYTTFSNLHHIYTKMARHPSYITLDSIIAEDNGNRLAFTIDPVTELRRFKVVRWEISDTNRSIFSAKDTLHRFKNPNTISYLDQSDSWAARTRSFHYKIDAMNGCIVLAIPEKKDTLFKVVSVSNLPNTIITKVYAKTNKNEITWTPFIDTLRSSYKSNTVRYKVTRFVELNGVNDSMNILDRLIPNPVELYKRDKSYKYLNRDLVDESASFTDDISDFEWKGYSQKFCYQVEAIETNPGGNQVMLSRSRKVCTEVVPGVTMPDAIKPKDFTVVNGHARNMLTPVINFEANYSLYIYSRWGEVVFEGRNQGWDGKLRNGQFVKEGTYTYRLVINTLGNRDVIKIGSVTVVY